MPVMNGLEAGAILKAMLPKVPIVMYTVHDTAGMKVQALAAGVRAFIERHDMDGLAGRLRELLEQALRSNNHDKAISIYPREFAA